ncbi:MAG: hypothetical protein BBJ57_13630 [Desulfobacterales bacterium PC51MH44]|nr:MAG: hypothetical protein BBJ57_13630 [Desulfobacterales bacterium PC51MH44]
MPQIQGIKGEAVVVYCEPLITWEMGYHRLSRRVNKIGFCSKTYISLIEELRKYIQTYKMHNKIKYIKCFSRFVYDQLGFKLISDKS